MANTANLNLPFLSEGQSGAEFTHNDAVNGVDALCHLAVEDVLNTPPGSPVNGQRWFIDTVPTGAWVGHAGNIAFWYSGWIFYVPKEGWRMYIKDTDVFQVYNGTTWSTVAGGALLNKLDGTAAPTANDDAGDGYSVGSLWVDVTNDIGYICVDSTTTAAIWKRITPKHLTTFRPQQAEFPTSNFATPDTLNNHPVLDFDTTTQEACIFSGIMPDNYRGGNIKVTVLWYADTATTGTGGWDVTFEYIASTVSLASDGFATAQVITAAAVNGTAQTLSITSVTITAGSTGTDSVVAGGFFRLRVRRDVATDTAAGDLCLRAVIIEEV